METFSPKNGNLKPDEFYKNGFWLNNEYYPPIAGAEEPPAPPADWKSTIPDDIKSDPIWEKYKEPADAFKALVGAQKFLGREKLPVPSDDNDTDTYNLIYNRLGRPENHDLYKLPTDLEIPKELPVDEEMLKDFRRQAHELGLSDKQFSSIYKWYFNNLINQQKQFNDKRTKSTEESESSLRKEWGAAYNQNVALAQKVVNQFADDKAWETLDGGLGNNPIIVKMLSNIGKVLSEDQLHGKPDTLTLSPVEAQNRLNAIKGDMKHAYWDSTNPNHKAAVEEFSRLQKLVLAGQ